MKGEVRKKKCSKKKEKKDKKKVGKLRQMHASQRGATTEKSKD